MSTRRSLRRTFAVAAPLAVWMLFHWNVTGRTVQAEGILTTVDHLVYATPDLEAGVDAIEKLLGVRATPGGQHPGRGTRNALLALGPGIYLEIIGPDPEQPDPPQRRPFGIDQIQQSRLVTWAAKSSNLESLVERATRHNVLLGSVTSGSRRRADGVLLEWRYTDPRTVAADGIVPFFIDWGRTPHPSTSSAQGATLVSMRAEHPEAERVQGMLKELGIDLRVTLGPKAVLVATIESPRGRVELR